MPRSTPKPPPCEQYGPDFQIMRPNWRPYCRKKTAKKSENKKPRTRKNQDKNQPRSRSKVVSSEGCRDQPQKIIENFKTLLNLDSNADRDDVCHSLELFTREGKKPTSSQIIRAGYAMGIRGCRDKKESEILSLIEKKIEGSLTPPFRRMIRLLKSGVKGKTSFHPHRFVNLINHIIRPEGFPETPPQPVSDEEFEEMVQIKKKQPQGEYLARDREALLEQCLTSRVCHCIKENFLVHKFRYEAMLTKPEGPNPYALCQSRTFNKRGIKGIGLRSGVCERRYEWFRRLHKVNGRRIPAFPKYVAPVKKTDKTLERGEK